MDKETLKHIVLDQMAVERSIDSFIPRESYQLIEPFIATPQVIILSGIRRCGKSTWMRMIRRRAVESNYYLNFDDERLAPFQLDDCQRLVEVFIELYGVQKTFYFDEMQNFVGWERFVRRLHNEGKKVFVTGSNANLLSYELGTHLTGRNIALHLFPYSFREYLQRENENFLSIENFSSADVALIKKYFSEFKIMGGFPEYLATRQKQYLHNLYENILYKDIIVRNNIENVTAIKALVYYLASNNAKEFTYNSLRKLLELSNARTVSDYCHFLENCFLCFTVNRFSFSVRKQAFSPKKIYFIDQALVECIGFRMSEDRGRMLENMVFLQLLRKNNEVYYHKEKKECDFVTREGHGIGQAIQVCESLQDPKTKKREIDGLIDALQTYQLKSGLIITEDESGEEIIQHDGKKYHMMIVPAWKWFLEK